jgi:hypothetical protein
MNATSRLTGGGCVDFGDESERVAQPSLLLGFLLATPLTLSKKQKSESADEGQGTRRHPPHLRSNFSTAFHRKLTDHYSAQALESASALSRRARIR